MSKEIGKILQACVDRYTSSDICNSVIKDRRILDKFYPLIMEQTRKWLANKLDPFKLCPDSLSFWFLVPPFSAIGVTIVTLQRVQVFWRQQMEPNQTIYLEFKLTEFETPFPLTLLVMFTSLALVITDAAYRVFEAITGEQEQGLKKLAQDIDSLSEEPIDIEQTIIKEVEQERHRSLLKELDPFNLTPRMSVFYPVYDHHTSLGFLTIDFRHIEFSVKQSLEPSENIISLFRFLDLYTPLPLQIAIMIISTGLFVNGAVHKFEKDKREEIIREVKRTMQ